MRNFNINVAALSFLIADPHPMSSSIVTGILRGFGAHRIVEARSAADVISVLVDQPVDMLLCEANLPPHGGFSLVHCIRQNTQSTCRTLPILITTGDTRISVIKEARDCGANMVVAKPMSPSSLYERLAWVAFNPRKFVDAANYFGPDRRSKIEGFPDGQGRRTEDKTIIGVDVGPALSQNEIDSLLHQARSGDAT